jgi:DNA-directed RNA polymerase subunit N (RpoN/RPB10)
MSRARKKVAKPLQFGSLVSRNRCASCGAAVGDARMEVGLINQPGSYKVFCLPCGRSLKADFERMTGAFGPSEGSQHTEGEAGGPGPARP